MVIDVIRWYVIGLAVLVAIIGAPMLWHRWPAYKIENKYVWLAVIALNFAIGYGMAESLWRGIPGGPRTLLTAIAETWLMVAVAYHPVEDLRRRLRLRRAVRLLKR